MEIKEEELYNPKLFNKLIENSKEV